MKAEKGHTFQRYVCIQLRRESGSPPPFPASIQPPCSITNRQFVARDTLPRLGKCAFSTEKHLIDQYICKWWKKPEYPERTTDHGQAASSFTEASIRYSECCQKLIDTYPDDLNSNLSTEFHQFHSYNKLQRLDSVMVNKIFVEDNIECAFPNVDISLRIFLTLMVTKCTTECSFSQMKGIQIQNRTMTRQKRLESLSLLMIEADLLRQINFEDLIKDFANKKCRRKLCKE
jgi:hypothetical protein